LQTVTPVYGGGARLPSRAIEAGPDGHPVARPERLDPFAAVRAPSVAAQVRSWWRILVAPRRGTPAELRERENDLWGSVHAGEPLRSQVDVWVTDIRATAADFRKVDPDWLYALWPARPVSEDKRGRSKDENDEQVPWAPRWKAGLTFTLHLRVPVSGADDVARAVKAWVLFGGYGSRTRRGCGALTVPGAAWLPAEATPTAIEAVLGLEAGVLADAARDAREIPALHGSGFAFGRQPQDDPAQAWKIALRWLRDFRQEPGDSPWHARGNSQDKKPGRSRWPEPDKIRRLGLAPAADKHKARYGAQPAWPRAGLGLPIVFSAWQRKPDPPLMLAWQTADCGFERLASPLIVKPLPLAGGRFAPLALWLHRANPKGAIVLRQGDDTMPGSTAPFEPLLGDADEALFAPLRGATTLREAFFAWLRERHGEQVEVFP